jgi:hypothetical protein
LTLQTCNIEVPDLVGVLECVKNYPSCNMNETESDWLPRCYSDPPFG